MIDERLRAYAEAVSGALPDDLRSILEDAAARGDVPAIHVSPQVGRILQLLVLLRQPRRVVEIGTLVGFSTAYLARMLPPGAELITIEKEPGFAAQAREHLTRLGLADRVDVRVGDAAEVLATLTGPVDMIVIDADKRSYPAYLKWAHRHLAPGGLLVADDAFAFGHVLDREIEDPALREAVVGVRTYNHVVGNSDAFFTVLLETEQGLAISVRTGEAP